MGKYERSEKICGGEMRKCVGEVRGGVGDVGSMGEMFKSI